MEPSATSYPHKDPLFIAIGQTCPVKTASAVLKTSETAQKIDIQQILA
jgi:hypothetical protein